MLFYLPVSAQGYDFDILLTRHPTYLLVGYLDIDVYLNTFSL